MMKKDEIKFTTNTAWLLNMWFPDDSKMWSNIRKWIKRVHDGHWKGNNSSLIDVTFTIKKEEVMNVKVNEND